MSDNRDEFTRFRDKALAKSSREVMDNFKETLRQDMEQRSENIQPWHSFWYHRPTRDFPPKSIRHPSEYDGGDRINIVCTQTELKPSEQKKLVQSWCEALPGLDKVEYIWFSSRANQQLFDAVCQMKSIKGLSIKWSGIKSIEAVAHAKTLKYLSIGSSPSITPLAPLAELPLLEWLELENIRASADLSFVSGLTGLKGLRVAGDGHSPKYLNVERLEPLLSLQSLYWLSLNVVKVQQGGLAPLARLRALKYLFLSNKYEMEDVAALVGSRPDIECDLFTPVDGPLGYIRCKKCGQQTMMLLTGKGKPSLCQSCDADKIARHLKTFDDIANKYLKWSKKI
ncbi:hypothetical protein [Marinobacterium stanieri]|uniref:Uncharacterized protein n=1 Tax=Marinobacterium stanieri TaxID=49186 RepID=A0A1N6UW53_9GAMM|nr:hypothetical protein [Marinobacterium stanieri]SIQ69466.1 hypothetical protein SAMN05421647_107242 [Marinobacterium stanieri]